MKYVTKKGDLLTDDLFDDDGYVLFYIFNEIGEHVNELPAGSDAVILYYAEIFATETHGNYDAHTLYRRAR